VIVDAYDGLAVGTYNGSITISGNFSGSPETIPVTLNVTAQATTPTTGYAAPTVSQVQGLTATANTNSVALNWQPATASDNGVVIYNLYRTFLTTTCTNAPGNYYIAQVHGTSYTDSSLPAGTYYYCVQSQDTNGNYVGSLSAQVSATVSGPVVSTSTSWNNIVVNPLYTLSIKSNEMGSLTLSWPAATSTNGIALYNVYRSTQDMFTISSSNLIGQTSGLSYTDSNLATGVYYYAVVPQDFSGKTALQTYTHSSVTGASTAATSSPITMQVDSATPAATQVPTGATGVNLLAFDIVNPSNDPVKIMQLTAWEAVGPNQSTLVDNSTADFVNLNLSYGANGQAVGQFQSLSLLPGTPPSPWGTTLYPSNLVIPANTTEKFLITGVVPQYAVDPSMVGTVSALRSFVATAIDTNTNASVNISGSAIGNAMTITQGQ
jgi:hypothetical protein